VPDEGDVMPTITIILPGPEDAAINKARRCGCRGRTPYSYPTDEHERWRDAAKQAVAKAVELAGWEPPTGPVSIDVMAYWRRKIAKGPMSGAGIGDFDAPIKAVSDALQHGGAILDDKQITDGIIAKRRTDGESWISVTITVLPEGHIR
jgi:Holliday junction resolvase RusA-like endonuclease